MPTGTAIRELPSDAALRRLMRLGETLDQVMTIDIAGRGSVGILYRAARDLAGEPLSTMAALTIARRVKAGDKVILATGFPVRPWINPAIGETDGPPGVAALAWGLSKGLRCVPIIIAPRGMINQVHGALSAAGVLVLDSEEALRSVEGSRPTVAAVVHEFPTDEAVARETALRLMNTYEPSVLIAVEHPGPSSSGVYHSSIGVDISEGTAKAEMLFQLGRERNRLTMSFTDMPNEIGSGGIRNVAASVSPYAERCQCPCGCGMASTSVVDLLVVSAVANWGAYAAMAALSVILNDRSVRFTKEQDARAIAGAMGEGAVEGLSGTTEPSFGVDGISTVTSGHVVDLLCEATLPWYGLHERAPF